MHAGAARTPVVKIDSGWGWTYGALSGTLVLGAHTVSTTRCAAASPLSLYAEPTSDIRVHAAYWRVRRARIGSATLARPPRAPAASLVQVPRHHMLQPTWRPSPAFATHSTAIEAMASPPPRSLPTLLSPISPAGLRAISRPRHTAFSDPVRHPQVRL
ncbi:hypothetical protein B0H16DRAFT_1571314 [Mycena metata]|uniref:Uncharacterized protein n=1 Tax=Mycena metata TaxID=1033252 RepID=A0AAD7I9B0_9AGAR|nr:hypothetical protein B0H16DRAFT_1571314 [Mycena metata]